jgi:DNA-binding transcriptional ArsR family regulator
MGAKQAVRTRENGASSGPAAAADEHRFEVLHHPWRIRILDVLAERSMSVAGFVDEGLIPELARMDRHLAISKLAYHFRVLRQAGALEVVEQNPRRGSTELVCRATARVRFSDDEWAKLSQPERAALSQFVLHELIARAESAVQRDTFDSRPDRHLSWLAMEVDERGWLELADVMNGVLDAVSAIDRDSKERLQASGEKPIRATWGQLHFESPPLPPFAAPRAD